MQGAGAYANRVAQTFLVQSEVKRLQGINVLKTWYTGYSSEYCEFAAVPQDTVTPAVVSSPPLGDTPFEVAAPCIEHAQPVEPAVSLLADEHVAATMLWRAAYSASNKVRRCMLCIASLTHAPQDIMQYQVARRLCPNMTAHKMDAIFAADPLLCGHMPKLAAAQQQFLLKHGGTMNTSASAGDTVEVFKVHAARMCALFTIMRTVFKEQPPLEMNSTRTFFAVMGAYGLNTPLTNGVCFNNCCYVMRRRIEKAVHAQHVAHFNETVTHAIVY